MASRIGLLSTASKLLKKNNGIYSEAVRCSSNGLSYKQSIANMPATQLSVLDNNMRVATEEMSGPQATVGVYLDSGSRYETSTNNGVGKFLERMSFKGTSKRSAVDLELEVAGMGATIQSFTGREQSGFVANCQRKDVPKMVELLAEIVQDSTIEQSEMEKQRGLILQEMGDSEDINKLVSDHMHSLAFQGTPLGLNPSGTSDNFKTLTRDDLLSFRNNNYCAPRIVLAGAGDIDHSAFTDLANKHFGKLQADDSSPSVPPYCRYTGSEVRMRDDDMPTANIVLALQAPGWSNPDHLVLNLASSLLGSYDKSNGDGANTSFRLARACYAGNLAQSYRTFNVSYSDTGLFGVHVASYKMTIEDLMHNLYLELMRFCETITDFDIDRAKNMYRTQLMLEQHDPAAVCRQIGTQTLAYGRKIPFAELDSQIAEIDGPMFREVCAKYIYDKCPVVVAMGPIEQLFTYVNIRSNLYWLRV